MQAASKLRGTAAFHSLLPFPTQPHQVVSQGRAAAEGELVVMPNLDGVQVRGKHYINHFVSHMCPGPIKMFAAGPLHVFGAAPMAHTVPDAPSMHSHCAQAHRPQPLCSPGPIPFVICTGPAV